MCLGDEKIWESSRKFLFYNNFKNAIKHLKIFFWAFSGMQPNT